MRLEDLTEIIVFDNHYIASLELTKAFEQRKINGEYVRIYYSHVNGVTSGTLKEIKFEGKTLKYLESPDGCIYPATFYQLPHLYSRGLTIAAHRIINNFDTCFYLKIDQSGFFVDPLVHEFVYFWAKQYSSVTDQKTEYGLYYFNRPLKRLNSPEKEATYIPARIIHID